MTGKPIKSVFFELYKENLMQPEEGLTDDSGTYTFKIKDIGTHYITASKVGYERLIKKVNFTKGFLMSEESGTYRITVPMIQMTEDDT